MKEKKKLTKYGNVVLFPGAIERMLMEAHELAENYQFAQANELFEKVFQYTEGDEMSLSMYAYSLYEAKSFQKAKDVCEALLSLGPVMYFEAMELYLTICMQLRQFKQVEKIIESLLEEGAIPEEQLEKFERLKNLNADIAENQSLQAETEIIEEVDVVEFDVALFLEKTVEEQMMIVHDLTNKNIRPFVTELKGIVENTSTHPFIQSLILVLLVEQQVAMDVTVTKFDRVQTINPAELELPTKLPQFQAISEIALDRLEQEPSILELVQYLIAKHVYCHVSF